MRRTVLTILAGILLGFFLAVAAFGISPSAPSVPVASSDASGVSAASAMSTHFGALQARTHTALISTAPIVPFIRTLELGTRDAAGSGPGAVTELQRALVRAGVRPRGSKPTGDFGAITKREVAAFQKAKRIRPVTGIYGPRTHHALSPFYDLSGRATLQAVAHTRSQLQKYARITHGTSYAWLHRTSMAYSQLASRQFLPLLPGFPHATDCSGYATWVYKVGGFPDPSGFNYAIVGYTGTLAQHGTRIPAGSSTALHIGDLVFYGGGWPYGHVAIVVNGFLRLVSSHGGPGINVLPWNYRPVSAVRRYF